MRKIVLFCFVIASLAACRKQITVQGETGTAGSVALLAELPGHPEKVRLDSCRAENGSWKLRVSGLALPARVWIKTEKDSFSFIAGASEEIKITGRFPDSLTVEGSRLEREYELVGQVLSERYAAPMKAIREEMELLRSKSVPAKSDGKSLKALERKLEHYREYKARWLEKLVQANPTNELSLFILKEQVEDPRIRQELFKNIRIKNKKSNIFRLLVLSLPK
ncbi:MAG: hypothetical protein LBR65_08850 [Culturomica sp.]|jgi:hypothetical protein|nr:hypothetical protein [Culturomica sp.]